MFIYNLSSVVAFKIKVPEQHLYNKNCCVLLLLRRIAYSHKGYVYHIYQLYDIFIYVSSVSIALLLCTVCTCLLSGLSVITNDRIMEAVTKTLTPIKLSGQIFSDFFFEL